MLVLYIKNTNNGLYKAITEEEMSKKDMFDTYLKYKFNYRGYTSDFMEVV